MKTNIHFWSHLAQFFLEWEMFQTKVVEKIKTRILCSMTFSENLARLWDNVEKCGRAGQDTDDTVIWHVKDAIRAPDDVGQEYRRTLIIVKTYCFVSD